MGRQRRSRTHHGIRDQSRKVRTRKYTRDLDQIHNDIQPENVSKLEHQEIDTDKPGLAQYYCIQCAVYYINVEALKEHARGKKHKKRVKLLKEEPYTQSEADAAAGLGKVDNGKRGARVLAADDVAMADA